MKWNTVVIGSSDLDGHIEMSQRKNGQPCGCYNLSSAVKYGNDFELIKIKTDGNAIDIHEKFTTVNLEGFYGTYGRGRYATRVSKRLLEVKWFFVGFPLV